MNAKMHDFFDKVTKMIANGGFSDDEVCFLSSGLLTQSSACFLIAAHDSLDLTKELTEVAFKAMTSHYENIIASRN